MANQMKEIVARIKKNMIIFLMTVLREVDRDFQNSIACQDEAAFSILSNWISADSSCE